MDTTSILSARGTSVSRSDSGHEQSDWKSLCGSFLVKRLVALAVLFSIELGLVTFWLDSAQLGGRFGLTAFVRDWGPLILRGVVAFIALYLTFSYLLFRSTWDAISAKIDGCPVHAGYLAAHAAGFILFIALSSVIYGNHSVRGADLLTGLTVGAGIFAIASGGLAFVPRLGWIAIAQRSGPLSLVAVGAAIAAAWGGDGMRLLWQPTAAITFSIVRFLLSPVGSISADPVNRIIGNPHFSVEVAPSCSGLEGVGLILAFTSVLFILFHREYRFPHALILFPAGVAIIFLLNSVRIAALFLVGNAGFEGIAGGGFHSQAGWIVFTFVALCITVSARRLPWIAVAPLRTVSARTAANLRNPVAPWVVPFVALLAAGMVSRALSSDFEWFYPLRFLVVICAVWTFRSEYAAIDWKIDWTAPLAGGFVFIMWIAMEGRNSLPEPRDLANASFNTRNAWIFTRALAAVVTVPIAEELAFRGFLLRRIQARDFECISFRVMSWSGILISSVVFGLLHANHWLAGSIAGAVFAFTVVRRGRIGNAVVAHATANALLALDVLVFQHWELW